MAEVLYFLSILNFTSHAHDEGRGYITTNMHLFKGFDLLCVFLSLHDWQGGGEEQIEHPADKEGPIFFSYPSKAFSPGKNKVSIVLSNTYAYPKSYECPSAPQHTISQFRTKMQDILFLVELFYINIKKCHQLHIDP